MKVFLGWNKQAASKGLLAGFLLALFLVFLTTNAMAAMPQRVKVSLSQGTNADTTKITLNWTGFVSGDILERSLDGATWVDKTSSLTTSGSDAQYIEDNFPNWQVVYFKVVSGANSKRINVYPPIENGHANYADDTNQCKLCHITHTAQGKSLMAQASIKELCYTCHGGAATGSRYNVERGTTMSGGTINWGDKTITAPTFRRSLAGPFEGGSPAWNNLTASSSHDVFNENEAQLAPGGGSSMSLSCVTCHNAHPANDNYRMLNSTYAPVAVEAFAYYNTTAASVYDFQEVGNYLNNGMNEFCANCHSDYKRGAGSGSTTADSVYRHPTDVPLISGGSPLTTTLPTFTAGAGGEQKIFCGTCHYAHGTTVEGTNLKADATETTVLKRLNYMGVCEDCHKK